MFEDHNTTVMDVLRGLSLRLFLVALALPALATPPLAPPPGEISPSHTEADPQGNLWLKFHTIPGKTYFVEGSNEVYGYTFLPLLGGVFYGDGAVKSFFMRPAPPASGNPITFNNKPIISSDWLITLGPSDQPGDNLTMLVTRLKEPPETSWTIQTTQPIMRPFDQLGFSPTETRLDLEEGDTRRMFNLNFAISHTPLDLTGIPTASSLTGADAEDWQKLDAHKLNVMGFLQIPDGNAPTQPRPESDAIFFRVRSIEGDLNGNSLPDYWELHYNFNPYATGAAALANAEADNDNDGLSNAQEYALGTHPNLADTDGDGFTDGEEDGNDSDPLAPTCRPLLLSYLQRAVTSTLSYTPAEDQGTPEPGDDTPADTSELTTFTLWGAHLLDEDTDPVSYGPFQHTVALAQRFPFPETPASTTPKTLLANNFNGEVQGDTSHPVGAYVSSFRQTGADSSEPTNHTSRAAHYRFWLDRGDTVPTTGPLTRNFLHIRYQATDSTDPEAETPIESLNPVALTIADGERYSPAYDLTPAFVAPLATPDPNSPTPPPPTLTLPDGTVKKQEVLIPADIVPDAHMVGVIGDIIPSNLPGGEKHFVTPKLTPEIAATHAIFKVGMNAASFNKHYIWEGGEAYPNDNSKRKVKRDAHGHTVLIIRHRIEQNIVAKLNVWVVWTEVVKKTGIARYNQVIVPPTNYPAAIYHTTSTKENMWKFTFKILPLTIISNTIDRPNLESFKVNQVPGFGKPYALDPETITNSSGDDASNKWDVSRQMQVIVRNPDGILRKNLGEPTRVFKQQPSKLTDSKLPSIVAWEFPQNPAEGNDDQDLGVNTDEDSNPYVINLSERQGHAIGEIVATDAPIIGAKNHWAFENNIKFGMTFNFREFARVELFDGTRKTGTFWFRISDHIEWHHSLDSIYKSESGLWENAGSSNGLNFK